ncbi:hypothetical protein ABPG75_004816 [Micractinium tetrahymenae]
MALGCHTCLSFQLGRWRPFPPPPSKLVSAAACMPSQPDSLPALWGKPGGLRSRLRCRNPPAPSLAASFARQPACTSTCLQWWRGMSPCLEASAHAPSPKPSFSPFPSPLCCLPLPPH